MSKLIVKSPYISCGKNAVGYASYIATRDGVELLPQADIYMNYIATRPGAERQRGHGLFSDKDDVDLRKTMEALEHYPGKVWTHILSLRREDAARLGYDHAEPWRNLLKAHRNEIAAAMKISPDNFRWYAAFHDEDTHPHVHMMAWSADPTQGYLTKAGIRMMKSELTNDIFKQEMLHLYQQKSASRDQLVREARGALAELVDGLDQNSCDDPEVERLILELAQRLKTVTGKKQYGYLPKAAKKIVNEIVDELERIPIVSECYAHWCELQEQIKNYYSGEPIERLPLSQQKEFRMIKNAIIHEAVGIQMGAMTASPFLLPQLLRSLAQIFRQSFIPPTNPDGIRIDSKRRRKLMEKKLAQGHAYGDHEEQGIQMVGY